MNKWVPMVVGTLLILAAIFGPSAGINLYGWHWGERRIDNTVVSRIATAFVGLLLILVGLSNFSPK
jgi:hypothetical protein